MTDSIRIRLALGAVEIDYEGPEDLYRRHLEGPLAAVAAGRWRARPATAPAPAANPAPAPDETADDDSPAARWTAAAVLAALAGDDSRGARRDAVLAALLEREAAGHRDSGPKDVLAVLRGHDWPVRGLKPRPILAKMMTRTGWVEPGILEGTFRPTNAGRMHLARRSTG